MTKTLTKTAALKSATALVGNITGSCYHIKTSRGCWERVECNDYHTARARRTASVVSKALELMGWDTYSAMCAVEGETGAARDMLNRILNTKYVVC